MAFCSLSLQNVDSLCRADQRKMRLSLPQRTSTASGKMAFLLPVRRNRLQNSEMRFSAAFVDEIVETQKHNMGGHSYSHYQLSSRTFHDSLHSCSAFSTTGSTGCAASTATITRL